MKFATGVLFGLAVLFVASVGNLLGQSANFSVKPSAVQQSGGAVKISFTVSGATDVEVAVLGKDGKTVRHLAAGVLGGKNPPPAPLRAGLSQALDWDGNDDFGQPADAAAGPFTVRVRAGTGVKFGRFIGENPYMFGAPDSIAADEDGNVYVTGFEGNRNQHMRTIRVFDTEGRYLRTVMPFPADLPPGAMRDVAAWNDQAKTFRPRNLSSLNPEFYATGLHLAAASKAALILTDGGSAYRLDGRGAVLGDRFDSQPFWAKNKAVQNSGHGPVFLTASPDGKYLYLSGPFSAHTKYGHEYEAKSPAGAVYRMRAAGGDTMQPFVTIPVEHPELGEFEVKKGGAGAAWIKNCKSPEHFTEPHGPVHQVAVDAQGNVYVADREHDCVAIFDESGRRVGQVPVKYPHLLAVHPKTGSLYVMQYDCTGYHKHMKVLVRFDNVKAAATGAATAVVPAATFDFGLDGDWPSIALAAGKDKTLIWVSGVKGGVVALEDKGTEFVPAKTAYAPPAESLDVFNRIAVDQVRDEVYVSDGDDHFARFNGQTGEGGPLKKGGREFNGTDLTVGYDGLLYVRTGQSFSGPLERFTHDLDPAPYASGSNVLSQYIYGRYGIGNCEKGLGVGPDGKVYVSFMYKWVHYCVAGFSPDGKALKGEYLQGEVGGKGPDGKAGYPAELTSAIIGPIPQANGGVRVDLKGDIYVGMDVSCVKDPIVPTGLEKDEAYAHCTGSVVKFGPGGGTVPGQPDQMVGASVTGAKSFYPGLAPFSHPHLGTTCCVCRIPRFDIDRFGRLAIPNCISDSVRWLDNSGNVIIEFGRYGNFDSKYANPQTPRGRDGVATVAGPEIPLAWPIGAGVSEKAIYVLDIYNRRVVRADLTYAAEGICPVK